MVLTVEDTMVNRDRTGELKRVLEKVFAERCGLPVEVRFAYIPPSGGERRKQLERKIHDVVREEGLKSRSHGEEPHRYVTVYLKNRVEDTAEDDELDQE